MTTHKNQTVENMRPHIISGGWGVRPMQLLAAYDEQALTLDQVRIQRDEFERRIEELLAIIEDMREMQARTLE